jgi:mRNA-degrading endonuclease RelE of RelBE toxin-antitoxin system
VSFSVQQVRGTMGRFWRRLPSQMGAAMKKIVITPAVTIALRTLDDDARRRVDSWLTRLANWEGDEFVRRQSQSLDSLPGVYVLKTSTDLRIFFTVQEKTVTILDIGKEESILTSGHLPEAE